MKTIERDLIQKAIGMIEAVVNDLPDGNTREITDDIVEFATKMISKYKQ